MAYSDFLSFLIYTIITAFTPGPNNILALSSTSNYGFKKSRNLILGICFGFLCVMILCGIFSMVLINILPNIATTLKYIGAVYILWLAWHVATSKPIKTDEEEVDKPAFLTGFILQFINIKIILYGITALTSFILPSYNVSVIVIGFILLLTLIGSAGTFTWAFVGAVLRKFLNKYTRIVNIIMGLFLLESAISLIL